MVIQPSGCVCMQYAFDTSISVVELALEHKVSHWTAKNKCGHVCAPLSDLGCIRQSAAQLVRTYNRLYRSAEVGVIMSHFYLVCGASLDNTSTDKAVAPSG